MGTDAVCHDHIKGSFEDLLKILISFANSKTKFFVMEKHGKVLKFLFTHDKQPLRRKTLIISINSVGWNIYNFYNVPIIFNL